jgi:PAS domain S-box-containing protein
LRTKKHSGNIQYRALLEAAPGAMVIVNKAEEIVPLNLQAEKQFGYHRDEAIDQKVKDIISQGFADLGSAEDALAEQIGTGIELRGRPKDELKEFARGLTSGSGLHQSGRSL